MLVERVFLVRRRQREALKLHGGKNDSGKYMVTDIKMNNEQNNKISDNIAK